MKQPLISAAFNKDQKKKNVLIAHFRLDVFGVTAADTSLLWLLRRIIPYT